MFYLTKFLHKYDFNLYTMLTDDQIVEHLDEILLDIDSDDEFINDIIAFDAENDEEELGKFLLKLIISKFLLVIYAIIIIERASNLQSLTDSSAPIPGKFIRLL